MAKENDAPTNAGKGKGKVEEGQSADGSKKADEAKKGKDTKPIVNGTKAEDSSEGSPYIDLISGIAALGQC